jgi:hypothetical protein
MSGSALDVFGPRVAKRKKPTSSKLAEQNADKLIELMWPGAPVARAGKQVTWIFDARKQARFPISRAEDICGVFDRVVFAGHACIAIQATVHRAGAANVAARRRKIENGFIAPLVSSLGEAASDRDYLAATIGRWLRVETWGWEPRKAMHTWAWSWADAAWSRDPSVWRVKRGALVAEPRT